MRVPVLRCFPERYARKCYTREWRGAINISTTVRRRPRNGKTNRISRLDVEVVD